MKKATSPRDMLPERLYVLDCLAPYWQGHKNKVKEFCQKAIVTASPESIALPPVLVGISLPRWAVDIGVEGKLWVPREAALDGLDWLKVDWLYAAFWYLNGLAERRHEELHGPIHSYSYRLKGWDPVMWSHAWANRIALFIRRWMAHQASMEEADLLGPLPKPQIILTHDVDAFRKTWAIRMKQTAFHFFNSIRLLIELKPLTAVKRLVQGLRFFCTRADYTQCLVKAVQKAGSSRHLAVFNFYIRINSRPSPGRWLFDPGYTPEDLKIMMENIDRDIIEIGLHPGYYSWGNEGELKKGAQSLKEITGRSIGYVRQHWLRFSWESTWACQAGAGLKTDMTLGFNDRPGFRNGSALSFRPWDKKRQKAGEINACPLILMDSHLYDYKLLSSSQRESDMRGWIEEIVQVGGIATVLWHPHTLSEDYGWEKGYEKLLNLLDTHL